MLPNVSSEGHGNVSKEIRQVIHWGPLSNIEAYLQETERARRDGGSSCAHLWYSNKDFAFINQDLLQEQ